MNTSAFSEGLAARKHDEESPGLSDNPYPVGSSFRADWYKGYNYKPKKRETPPLVRSAFRVWELVP